MAGQEVGELYYKITGDTTSFDKSMESADKKTVSLGSTFKKVGIGAAAIGAAIIGAGVAAFKLAKDAGQAADQLLDLEQVTGLGTDTLQEMKFIAAEAGVSFEGLTGAAQKFTAKIPDIETGTSNAAKAFQGLGIDLRDSSGELRSQDELFPEIIGSLQGMENITERNAIAQQLFGRSLGDLAPVLGMTQEQFEALRLEANDVGAVLGRQALENANQFRASLDTLAVQSETTKTAIGATLAPIFESTLIPALETGNTALTNMANKFSEFTASAEGMERIAQISGTVAGSVAALGAIVTPILGGLFDSVKTIIEPFQELSRETEGAGVGATIFGGAVAAVTGAMQILSTVAASTIENVINFVDTMIASAELVGASWKRLTRQISEEEFQETLSDAGDAWKNFGVELVENTGDVFSTIGDVVSGFTENAQLSADDIALSYNTAYDDMAGKTIEALAVMAEATEENSDIIADIEADTTENLEDELDKRAEAYKNTMSTIADYVEVAGDTISSIWGSVNDYQDNLNEAELQGLQEVVDATETGTEERAAAEEALDKRKREIAREQAKRDKEAAIFSAVIDTSVAVVRMLADPGGVTGVVLSALALAAGIAEVAAISSQTLPSAEQGMVIPEVAGVPASGDNSLVRVNGGEEIIPADERGRDMYVTLKLDGRVIAQSTVEDYINKGQVTIDATRGVA